MLRSLTNRLLRVAPIVIAGHIVFAASAVVAARTLGSNNFSIYSTQLYVSALLATGAAGVQLDVAHEYSNGVRENSPSTTSKYFRSVMVIGGILGLVVVSSLPLLARFWKAQVEELFGLSIVPVAVLLSALTVGALQGVRAFRAMFVFSLLIGTWRIGVLLVSPALDMPIGFTMLIIFSGSIACSVLFAPTVGRFKMQLASLLTRRFVYLSLSSVSLWSLVYIDLLALRRLNLGSDAGAYFALLTVAKGMIAVPLLVGQMVFPDMADHRVAKSYKVHALQRLGALVTAVSAILAMLLVFGYRFALTNVFGFDVNQLPATRSVVLAAAALIPGALLVVVGNVAMAALSYTFAIVSAIVASVTVFVGVFLVSTVDQLLALSVLAPLFCCACTWGFRRHVFAWVPIVGAAEGQ